MFDTRTVSLLKDIAVAKSLHCNESVRHEHETMLCQKHSPLRRNYRSIDNGQVLPISSGKRPGTMAIEGREASLETQLEQ